MLLAEVGNHARYIFVSIPYDRQSPRARILLFPSFGRFRHHRYTPFGRTGTLMAEKSNIIMFVCLFGASSNIYCWDGGKQHNCKALVARSPCLSLSRRTNFICFSRELLTRRPTNMALWRGLALFFSAVCFCYRYHVIASRQSRAARVEDI
ncbi:hypothetical protein F4778DRAFT_566257 [Xylariomycetidae sp. FL2044]|nr:hypothetical protein F4778DRAFT_566257 [Xylariomycetidae sp. FL2044]